MRNIIIVTFLLFTSCISEFKKVKFVHYANSLDGQRRLVYMAKVPSGYRVRIYMVESEGLQENHYIYSDSSTVYLSNFGPTLNYENLTKADESKIAKHYIYENLTKEDRNKMFEHDIKKYNDTLKFSGKTKNGLYWKEIKIKDVSFGYINVTLDRKEKFDRILNNIHVRK